MHVPHPPEKREQAVRLREQGASYPRIAAELGVGVGTAFRWLNEDHAERCREQSRAWKERNAGVCDTCGGPTHAGRGLAHIPTRCGDCLRWEPEAIVLAFQEWMAENGRAPRCADARMRDGRLPSAVTVAAVFGSWSGGLTVAGIRPNQDKSRRTFEAIRDAIIAGESTASIAARYGVTRNAISQRMRNHGTSVRELRRNA